MMAGADEPATLSGLCQPMAIAMVTLSDGQSRIGVLRRRYVGGFVVSSSMVMARSRPYHHGNRMTAEKVKSARQRGVVRCASAALFPLSGGMWALRKRVGKPGNTERFEEKKGGSALGSLGQQIVVGGWERPVLH